MIQMLKQVFAEPRKGRSVSDAVPGVLSETAFEEQLWLERARSERAKSSFVLLHITLSAPLPMGRRRQAEQVLAAVLAKRTRAIDVKGRYRGGIGLILPYTEQDKVELVWSNLQEMYAKAYLAQAGEALPVPGLRCEVSVHPERSLEEVPRVS